jgi:branched-chain amino acid transport system ATP-binding protein
MRSTSKHGSRTAQPDRPKWRGKTTLFNMLTGELPPSGGQIFFGGQDITGASVHERARLGIGRSFQIRARFPQSPRL